MIQVHASTRKNSVQLHVPRSMYLEFWNMAEAVKIKVSIVRSSYSSETFFYRASTGAAVRLARAYPNQVAMGG